MIVSRIWNRWVQDGNTERLAVSQRLRITKSREDCYPHSRNGSCTHVMSSESKIGVVCKTTMVCMKSLVTLAAAWTQHNVKYYVINQLFSICKVPLFIPIYDSADLQVDDKIIRTPVKEEKSFINRELDPPFD
ncbi:hypothetical protein TNCV_292691 [Trichonephila clavipes]|nr:hypothetical protein TNCV_292691 [Trichonephila clavipes]